MNGFRCIAAITAMALWFGGTVAVSAQIAQGPAPAGSSSTEAADLILGNGQIYTPSGWMQALAVRKGVIIAVGNDESVRQFRAPQTRVIDLHGDTVVPGLHDMHVHPMSGGLQQLDRNPFRIPVTQIHQTQVKLAMINGEIVYQASASTKSP